MLLMMAPSHAHASPQILELFESMLVGGGVYAVAYSWAAESLAARTARGVCSGAAPRLIVEVPSWWRGTDGEVRERMPGRLTSESFSESFPV